MGNFIFALERLNEKGILSEGLSFLIGQHLKIPRRKRLSPSLSVSVPQSKWWLISVLMSALPPPATSIRVLHLQSQKGRRIPQRSTRGSVKSLIIA